jgi:hypothetical protein
LLALEIDFSLPAARVIRELDAIARQRGYRKFCDPTTGQNSYSTRS